MDTNKIDKLIVIGDRILIRPNSPMDKTKSGLLLPSGYEEKEQVRTGYVIKCGPGYPLPALNENDESWQPRKEQVNYLPLQVQQGDLAIFLQKNAIEIEYDGEKYFLVPQNAILLVERDEF